MFLAGLSTLLYNDLTSKENNARNNTTDFSKQQIHLIIR
jgi:hypothetical protein